MDSSFANASVSEILTDDLLSTSLDASIYRSSSSSENEDSDRKPAKSGGKISKQRLERKELRHTLQILKLELSQKSATIDNLRSEYTMKIDDLEDRLGEALHQKQIIQAQMEAQLQMLQDSSKNRTEKMTDNMAVIQQRQRSLEMANLELQTRSGEIRHTLSNIDNFEHLYDDLNDKNPHELALPHYAVLKFFEAIRPLRREINEIKTLNIDLNDKNRIQSEQIFQLQDTCDQLRNEKTDMNIQMQKLTLENEDFKSKIKAITHKEVAFDQLEKEKRALEQEVQMLRNAASIVEGTLHARTTERDDSSKELAGCRQALAILQQDKVYLTKQVNEANFKISRCQEKAETLDEQLITAKRAREELYEKYMSCREQYKTEYEERLAAELKNLRGQTEAEMERLRSTTRDVYDREGRQLREAREIAIHERDRLVVELKEARGNYESILKELHRQQADTDTKLNDLLTAAKVSSFEKDRIQLIYEENLKSLRNCKDQIELLRKKNEVILTKELYSLQSSSEKRIHELETKVTDNNGKLRTYEKLEKELDEVVMQAAEVADEADAEQLLYSYGYGANIPSSSKRRLQQSVHLARRILKLEKDNTKLKQDLQNYQIKNEQLSDEVANSTKLLNDAQQPYNYLIESIKTRDQQIETHKKLIANLQNDTKNLVREKNDLLKQKNQLSSSLERLLLNRKVA
ncbi:uncharacterized protein TRIADDRAFT_23663 [Trichoplax adhaerens]|uniref:Progesterone immunomodulatory binding factor 1 n=1 Tax=Trichoplax adhaerens TaxID=10228 RepID=B3RV13_TRIAD|nr:hypothetical protein TRIADDRAFT_23663 [Trichoplax adhaerens]EDV25416.1 hypothetical protein TRIADDRAFT_23663 [Trichoplax adhaerens]|eukprot:XP_002111449.1 hypothetical protein TRIADDRAFT_23663 [Trichoplax adhaerens]